MPPRLVFALGLFLALCGLLYSSFVPQSTVLVSSSAHDGAERSDHAFLQSPLISEPSAASGDANPTALGSLKRVAIIGAGASGSAAAFFLDRAARSTSGEGAVDIVVFERDGRVGGRSTTVRAGGVEGGREIELGASIFVDANKNLMRAVSAFNLSLVPFADDDRPSAGHDPFGMGLYDGARFLLTTSSALGWWEKAKILWRYGYASPTRTRAAVDELVGRFGRLYDAEYVSEHGGWEEVGELSRYLGLGRERLRPEEVTGEEWFRKEVGAGERWVDEMVEGVLRVNYAQDVNEAHGLAAAVSLATSGASSVAGGNWQIFDRMLRASGADVQLGTEVLSISGYLDDDGAEKFVVKTNTTAEQDAPFDAVFFANPYYQSQIELLGTLKPAAQAIPQQPYVHLHTTLLTTTAPAPNPAYFNLPLSSTPPSAVLTSGASFRHGTAPAPEFQSITYHGETFPSSGEWIVKIFSKQERNDEWLDAVFGEGKIGWVLRKEWQSYPYLPPTTSFPPLLPAGPSSAFFYLASLEPWISTMETQTLSARNAVSLLARRWWGVRGGSCKDEKEGEGMLFGWDWTCGWE